MNVVNEKIIPNNVEVFGPRIGSGFDSTRQFLGSVSTFSLKMDGYLDNTKDKSARWPHLILILIFLGHFICVIYISIWKRSPTNVAMKD